MKFKVKIDGGAQPNPGKSGSAAVFYRHQTHVPFVGYSIFLGDKVTNNVAEHKAFVLALEVAIERKISTLTVESDSKVVVNQFNGDWQVNDKELKLLVEQERQLALQLKQIEVIWVGRENVWEAHNLVEHELSNPNKIGERHIYTMCVKTEELWTPIYGI